MIGPEPETLESIRAQGTRDYMPSVHNCGCEYRQRWHLCQYHDGFEDGLEAASRRSLAAFESVASASDETENPHMDATPAATRIPTPEEQPTLSVWPEAGTILRLSRSAAYAAANSGDLPVVRFGRSMRVPTAALRRMLEIDGAA